MNRDLVSYTRFWELMPLDGAIQRKPSGPDPWLKYSGFRAGRVASSPLKQRGRHASGMASRADSKLPSRHVPSASQQIGNTSRRAGRKESAMGYNTKFEGEFRLDRPLDDDTFYALEGLDGPFCEREKTPSQWCQWKVGDDWQSIVWDGGEKFYGYIGWIRHINDKFLKPQKYVINVMSPDMLFPLVDGERGARARLAQIVAAAKKHERCGDADWHWSGR